MTAGLGSLPPPRCFTDYVITTREFAHLLRCGGGLTSIDATATAGPCLTHDPTGIMTRVQHINHVCAFPTAGSGASRWRPCQILALTTRWWVVAGGATARLPVAGLKKVGRRPGLVSNLNCQPSLGLHALSPTQGESTGAGVIFGNTGGVMEAALRTAYELATGEGVGVWYGWAVGSMHPWSASV